MLDIKRLGLGLVLRLGLALGLRLIFGAGAQFGIGTGRLGMMNNEIFGMHWTVPIHVNIGSKA